jgi:hypothetical protein
LAGFAILVIGTPYSVSVSSSFAEHVAGFVEEKIAEFVEKAVVGGYWLVNYAPMQLVSGPVTGGVIQGNGHSWFLR